MISLRSSTTSIAFLMLRLCTYTLYLTYGIDIDREIVFSFPNIVLHISEVLQDSHVGRRLSGDFGLLRAVAGSTCGVFW